jgi:hypothetical protein
MSFSLHAAVAAAGEGHSPLDTVAISRFSVLRDTCPEQPLARGRSATVASGRACRQVQHPWRSPTCGYQVSNPRLPPAPVASIASSEPLCLAGLRAFAPVVPAGGRLSKWCARLQGVCAPRGPWGFADRLRHQSRLWVCIRGGARSERLLAVGNGLCRMREGVPDARPRVAD